MPHNWLKVEEVTEALMQLGGEATWEEIYQYVTKNRNTGFAPYRNLENYRKVMFQHIQEHCEIYKKYKGQTRFVQVSKRPLIFRLFSETNSRIGCFGVSSRRNPKG